MKAGLEIAEGATTAMGVSNGEAAVSEEKKNLN